jgi:hypothetical protein
VLFEQRFWPGLADGSVTLTFRRWKRRQVVAGHRYRTPAAILEVVAVDVVAPESVTDAEARLSGYDDAATLRADLRGTDELPLYRIAFHVVEGPDPRADLAATAALSLADRAEIDRRLDRLDRASSHGAWTRSTLHAIGERPATRAADLAASFGRETQSFKADVRKLKNLGLTISLDVGYRLSPRGVSYRDGST